MSYLDVTQRAELGIDGNCGFALLGRNIQEGEAEFVEIPNIALMGYPYHDVDGTKLLCAKLCACKEALHRLRKRLNLPNMSYYFGESHPYGS